MGIDPGEVRFGLAVSDGGGVLAVPLGTVHAGRDALGAIAKQVTDSGAELVVVGLPRSMDGSESHAATKARVFAASLAGAVSVPVRLVDERLTTVSASRALSRVGRTSKQQREVIDQAAAVELLQSALDQAKRVGAAVGELVSVAEDPS